MSLSAQDAQLVRLDRQLCFKLYAASRLVIKAYRPLLTELDITYPQYLVLMVLWEQPEPLNIGQLGERLMLDTGTLTPLLKRMEQQQLLSRSRGKSDERQVWVSLTDRAWAMQKTAVEWVKVARSGPQTDGLDTEAMKAQLQLLIERLS